MKEPLEVEISDLTGAQLDYWVAKAEGLEPILTTGIVQCLIWGNPRPAGEITLNGAKISLGMTPTSLTAYSPSTNWSIAGPIIEKHHIGIRRNRFGHDQWIASIENGHFEQEDESCLVAAMRCFVASKIEGKL